MIAVLPPAGRPWLGLTLVTAGGIVYVNWSAGPVALVPPTVVTVTSTVPVPAGLVAVIWVALTTENVVAAVAPKCTALDPVKLVPVMVTTVPPAVGPWLGARPLDRKSTR